ncbi:MAG: hypothetical protein ACK59A_00150 [Cyanobacteriota bacterium]
MGTGRLARGLVGMGSLLGALLGAGTPPLKAEPPITYPPDQFPPAAVFRGIQLTTLACGRENTAERCAEARQQADPLLDHPRLPARCKDVLWSIRNLAVAAPINTLTRRDPIDQAAAEVTIACRQVLKAKPESKPQGSGTGQGQPSLGADGQP